MKFFGGKEVFSSDLRSLALFRIGLGILIIVDLINRARSLKAHYTDFGVLPRNVLIEEFLNKWHVSFHLFSGDLFIVGFLFLISGTFALMLLFGYKTRFAVIASWILLISLQSRNYMVLQGGDILFRMLLFWAMFLPLGRIWSIDSLDKRKVKKRILNIGSIGILMQIFFLYLFTALLKTGKEWFPEGSAVYYALSIDQFTTPFGYLLLEFDWLMKGLTFFVLFYWYVGAIMLLNPFLFGFVRTIVVFLFMFIQIGMGMSMELGLFPYIAIVAMFALLPSWFWDKVISRFRSKKYDLKRGLSIELWKTWRQKVVTIIGAFVLIYILLWNFQTVGFGDLNSKEEIPGHLLRLDQKWNMFSPFPLKDDGWYVIPAKLRNGDEVDLFLGREISYEKPERVALTYESQRWRKYMMNIWQKRHNEHRLYYGRYLCRDWNSKHSGGEILETFEIVFMKELTVKEGNIEPERIVLWNHDCFG